MRDDLGALLRQAAKTYRLMTPAEREALVKAQARSWARAEVGFGSDADEAAYRAAVAAGYEAEIERLEAESVERVAQYDAQTGEPKV